jgi:hydrogen cyanide synthase HcnC
MAAKSEPTLKMGNDSDVVVIGGGVVGMSVAYGLGKAGLSVTILDEGDGALRASRGNFALVWVQGKGIDMPEYARWSLQSADLWEIFAQDLSDETGIDLGYSRRGGFMAYFTEAALAARVESLSRLHNQGTGVATVETLDHKGMKAMLPDIGPEVIGGTYCAADGHVNALRFFSALHQAASQRGMRYQSNATVTDIKTVSDGFQVSTTNGEFRARKVVLAAGLGNARLAPMVGLHAPVSPQRGQVMVTEKLAPFLDYPFGTVRQTDEGGVMIGDSQEEVGFNTGNEHKVLADIAQRAIKTFPLLAQAQIIRSWGALRVMSSDGHPLYDHSPTMPGAYLVTCHSGITLAAVHARVIADAIAGDTWPDELTCFSAKRFETIQPSSHHQSTYVSRS